jgi:hypothetical protein
MTNLKIVTASHAPRNSTKIASVNYSNSCHYLDSIRASASKLVRKSEIPVTEITT